MNNIYNNGNNQINPYYIFKLFLRLMLTNISYIFLIIAVLVIGGWSFKAIISLAQGKALDINLKNPLNLKARWPKETKEK